MGEQETLSSRQAKETDKENRCSAAPVDRVRQSHKKGNGRTASSRPPDSTGEKKKSQRAKKKNLRVDHLQNYGSETRFGASQARIGFVVCVSHWSFRFSSALECLSIQRSLLCSSLFQSRQG